MRQAVKTLLTGIAFSTLCTLTFVPIASYFFGDGFRLTPSDAKYFVAGLAVFYFNRWLSERAAGKNAEEIS